MDSPQTDSEHWWAVEALIASYNHVYRLVYNTRYEQLGAAGVSVYGDAPIASFQYEFLALSADAQAVVEAVRAFPMQASESHVLDVFHAAPSAAALKTRYAELGYEFVRTGMILGLDLPVPIRAHLAGIHKVETAEQVEFANRSLAAEGERIPLESVGAAGIHNFYAERQGRAVGWAELVTVYPEAGYIHQVYTLSAFRRRGIGAALTERAHAEANALGLKHVVLVPSIDALRLFRRLGYRPLIYFTAFRPASQDQ